MFENIDSTMVMTIAVAFAWAFMLMQWVQFIREFTSIKPQLLPDSTNWSDRAAVLAMIEQLKGKSIIETRLRSLLSTWSRGASHIDIVELASTQSARVASRIHGALIFAVLVLAGAMLFPGLKGFAAAGLGVAGATAFLYLLVLGRIDCFIERNLIDKLPGQIEGLKITADDLAQSLGGAIEKAFRDYVPQPEKLAAAISGAVEASLKNASGSLDAMHKRLLDVQEALATKLSGMQKDSAVAVEASQKKQLEINETLAAKWSASQKDAIASIESAQKKFLEGQQAVAEKQAGNQKEMVLSLETARKAMDVVVQQLQSNLSGSSDKWQAALQAHSQQITQANQSLATQLEKIQAMGKEIEKVLHIQQTVDNTIKSVTTTEDFKNTLATLKSHLEKSDNLLREVTKPRTIRLVESSPEAK